MVSRAKAFVNKVSDAVLDVPSFLFSRRAMAKVACEAHSLANLSMSPVIAQFKLESRDRLYPHVLYEKG